MEADSDSLVPRAKEEDRVSDLYGVDAQNMEPDHGSGDSQAEGENIVLDADSSYHLCVGALFESIAQQVDANHGSGDTEAKYDDNDDVDGSSFDGEDPDYFEVDALELEGLKFDAESPHYARLGAPSNSNQQTSMIKKSSREFHRETKQMEPNPNLIRTPAAQRTAASKRAAKENDKRMKLNEAMKADSRRFCSLANTDDDKDLQAWSNVFAEFYSIYEDGAAQLSAKTTACNYSILFANTKFAPTLLDILQLLPSKHQTHATVTDLAGIEDQQKSWLDDNMIGLVVHLSHEFHGRSPPTISFGQGIATGLDEALNELFMKEHSTGYLQYMLQQYKSRQGKETDIPQFIFPATTETIVIPWNFTGNHWVVINIKLLSAGWEFTVYNSFDNSGRKRGGTWKSVVREMPFLQEIICLSSGISAPSGIPSFHLGKSAQQDNSHDCGVMSISNALALLNAEARS